MKSIKEQLDELQTKIFAKNDLNFFLRYVEEGNTAAISLVIYKFAMDIEVKLWDSESDPRDWVEDKKDYEDFKAFIQRKVIDCLQSFVELLGILQNKSV